MDLTAESSVLSGGPTTAVPLVDLHGEEEDGDDTEDDEDQDDTWLAGGKVVALDDDRHGSGLRKGG